MEHGLLGPNMVIVTACATSNHNIGEAWRIIKFGDADIHTCGAWCQGISLAQAFRMLDGINLKGLRHNSADYIHMLTEVFKLVFAYRE